MYQAIVQKKLRAAFAGLNAGKVEAVTREFSATAEHHFTGLHALGGTRRDPALIRQWYERLLRLMPDIHFEIDDIASRGPPWDTLAAVRWRESNSGTDGVLTRNAGVNVIRIRWGRVSSVAIFTDTVVLCETLDRLAAAGVTEAHAPPIQG